MNLIILEQSDAIDNLRFVIHDHRADHIRQVLRCGVGNMVEVGLVNAGQASARIESCSPDCITLVCESFRSDTVLCPEVDIICAIPRPKALKRVLTLAATMRIRALHLVRACRVEKSYLQSPWLQPERYRACLLEGLSQGKQTRLPDVHVHDLFRPFVEDRINEFWNQGESGAVRLVADPDAQTSLHGELPQTTNQVVLAIGPEGGWVPFELSLLHNQGFHAFTLGPWILRVETAVAVAMGQIAALQAETKNRGAEPS
jgi:16S rRNA (uracil1498-N3)-methyltransferase